MKTINDFNFKPVIGSKGIDYYENKKMYLIKNVNGVESKVW